MGKIARLPVAGAVMAVDRLTDGQLMAVQARVLQGWNNQRIAHELGIDQATLFRWFRDPLVMAAGVEMTRAYAGLELLPLGLQRLRLEIGNPMAKAGDIVRATELFAKLAGLSDSATGAAPYAGRYAPVANSPERRALSELTANELQDLATRGRDALEMLQRQHAEPAPQADNLDSLDGILD